MPLPKIRRRERPLGSTSLQPFKPFHDNFRLATEYVSPDELNPPPRILRKHGKRNIKIIVASIREHGFNNPILIDDANRIVCGYGRWLAAEEIGIRSVPVIRLSHLTPEQIRLYRIADNKIAEQSEFDLSELRIEFQELEALELDLNLELTG